MGTSGREVTVSWRGTTVRAWSPVPLSKYEVELSESVIRATERAAAASREAAARIPTGFEPLARLLLRAEGLASSHVEGIEAPIEAVVLAEVGADGSGSAAHVADNLHVVEDALAHAAGNSPLTKDLLYEWHRRLMLHGSLPEEFVGRWRSEVGWIGGASPTQAVFVPAPPDDIDPLMHDLIAVANRCPWDAVTSTALVHAQFETVHPFGDGNGRIGRVLALWMLARHLADVSVPPPMSVLIARDTDAYIAALGAFRIGMDEQLVGWFSAVVTSAAHASTEWAIGLDELGSVWERRVSSLRADSVGRKLLDLIGRFPVLSAATVAEALGVSLPAARNGLVSLVDLGILEEIGTVAASAGRPRRWWAAPELLDLVARWTV